LQQRGSSAARDRLSGEAATRAAEIHDEGERDDDRSDQVYDDRFV